MPMEEFYILIREEKHKSTCDKMSSNYSQKMLQKLTNTQKWSVPEHSIGPMSISWF